MEPDWPPFFDGLLLKPLATVQDFGVSERRHLLVTPEIERVFCLGALGIPSADIVCNT